MDGRDPPPPDRAEVADCFERAADVVGRDVAEIRSEADIVHAHAGNPRLDQSGYARVVGGETVQDDAAHSVVAAAAKIGVGIGVDGGEEEQVAAAGPQARLDALEQPEKDRVRAVRVLPGDRRHADYRRPGVLCSHLFGRERVGLLAKELPLSRLPFNRRKNLSCRMFQFRTTFARWRLSSSISS